MNCVCLFIYVLATLSYHQWAGKELNLRSTTDWHGHQCSTSIDFINRCHQTRCHYPPAIWERYLLYRKRLPFTIFILRRLCSHITLETYSFTWFHKDPLSCKNFWNFIWNASHLVFPKSLLQCLLSYPYSTSIVNDFAWFHVLMIDSVYKLVLYRLRYFRGVSLPLFISTQLLELILK